MLPEELGDKLTENNFFHQYETRRKSDFNVQRRNRESTKTCV